MAFDVAGAKQAGYSDIEIAEFLGQQKNFDVAGAIKSGYSPAELISYLGAAKPAQSKERTFGEAAADVGAGLVGGAGKLIQLPGQLYGLATGDFSETGSLGLGKKIEQAGEEMKSAGLKAREQERAEKIAEAEKRGQISAFGTALGETLKDPGLLLNFLAEQAPQLLVPFGAAKVGSALTAGRAGTRAAIGAGAVQQGADIGSGSYEDIYKELIGKGVSEADAKQSALNLARASGASGALISLLAQKLPGARRLEEAMAGVPSKTGRIRGAVGTAAGETLGEIPEEVGGKFTQNLAMREVKPEQELTAGLGETAAMAAIGGAGLGGAAGLARGRAKPEIQTIPEIPATEEIKAPPELQQLIDRVSGVSAAPEQQDLLTSEEANRQRINMLQQKVDEDAKLQEEKARSQGIPPSVPPSPPQDVSKPSLYETELPQATPQEELDTKQAEIDQLRLDAGLPTGASSKTPGVQPTTTTPEETLKPKIVDERPLQERAAKNRLLVLQNMLKNEGGDPNSLSIVPHPEVEGKFAIQSLDVPVKFQKDLKATASDRPESTPVIDPVNAYIEIAKRTNTPASMRLVKDFQEGIVTREDIEAAIEAERKANQPMPINYQGNGEPWFIAPVTYKPRGERVITEPIEEVDEVTEDPTVGEGVDPPTPTTEMPQTLGEFKLRMPAAFDNPDVRAANKNASFPDLMQALMQSKNPVIKRIGELGNQISNQVTLQKTKYLGNRYAGLYYPALDAIKISPKYAGDETTNAHETLHALIYRMQKNPTTKQKASVKKIEDLYQHVKRELAKQGMGWDGNKRKKKYAVQVYGLADQYEFAAEAMGNPEFQYMLMQIPYKGKRSAWSEFTRYVAELLGIKDTNALTEILNLVDKIAQTKRPARNYLSNKVVRNEVVYKEIEEAERETDQKPTKKGEENVARPDESTGGTGVQVPVRAANELPAAQGVKGTQQRGVASVRPTPAKPAGGAGIQPTPVDKRKLYKEPEPIKGEPMPLPTEVAEAEKNIEQLEKLRRKVETKERGPSLFNKIRGTLSRQEMSELTDAPKNIFVAANSEKKGALLTDLVADGYFDDFLPYGNRATDPRFDESSATEYIKDKIRNRNYLSYATEQEIKQLNGNAAQLGEIVSEHARIEEANALAQEATEEGRNEALESSEKGTGYKIDPQEQSIEKELAGKNFMQVAQWAVRSAPNAFAKVIAQKVLSRLQGMQSRGVKFDFQIKGGDSRPGNLYGARGLTNFVFGKTGEDVSIKITLNGATVMENQDGYPSGMNYVTVLHELLHAATRGQLKYLKSTDPLVKELSDLRNQVVRYFNSVDQKDMTPFMKRVYNREINALNDIDEMVSWGMTDEDMQKFLSKIKVGEKSVFTKLIETIRKILGLGQPYESALDRLVRTTESILDESVEVIGGQIESQGYSFGTKKGKKSSSAQQSLFSKKAQEIFGEEFALGVKEVKEKVRGALQKQKPISAEAMSDLDPSFVKALNKQFKPENKTFIDKAEGFKEDMWKKLAQGIADQYRSIKDYSEEAYMMARMSKSVDGALEGILFHGHVFNDGGALNIKQNTKGLIEAMKPLGKDVDRYQMWVALNRDARLPKEKRSFDPDLVAKRDQLAQGTLNGKPRLEVFKDVQGDMNALNRSVLDVAYKAGLINSDAYDIFSNDIFYIPFYKQMEDGDIQGASTASGLVGQKFSNQLKGGDKQLGDLMENTLRNWSHILSASMKNQAANETIKAAEGVNAAVEVDKPEKGAVKVMRNGDPTYFKVLDPMLLDSIMSIGYMGPKSKFLDVAKDFKNILQFGVTISPAFKVRNLFRDSISAIAVTDLKRNPFANVIEGWIASNKNNPAHISALAGGAIFNFGSTVEGDQAKLTKRLIEKGVREQDILDTPEKVKEGLKYIWDKYQEFGNKSESANRMALYNQLVKNGKTHLEASFYARDMLDFSMQGSFGTIRTLAQVVPFFNARVQGLYKLGRDGVLPTSRVIYNTFTGKPIEQSDKKKAESFSIVTGAVALASMALYLGFKDDEEFQKREAWDRDNFWWFRLPGMEYAIRIPKPFEVGAFGTIAERTLEQIIDQNAEGKQFGESLSRMLWDTFSMNPMPQVFKPLVDLYANKDSFTGAPIESAGMERLSKQERATDSTSPIAKLLGGMSTIVGEGVSPVQVDYAIKAYLGWLGGSIASMSTYAVAPFRDGEYPDVKAVDMVSQGFIKSLPSNQSRYVTSFYENNKQVNQAFADMRHYAELGDSEKVQKIMEEKGDLIALQKLYDKTAKNMANVRKQIRMITDDKEMDGATKREEIDRMKQLISMMAEQAESIRKSTKS